MASLTPRLDRLERNLIINGNFDFWQRGTSFASLSNVNTYTADRFRFEDSAAHSVTVSRSTDVPTLAQSGFQSLHSMLLTNGTGASPGVNDVVRFRYRVEGFDYQAIHGRNCRLQFWVKTSVSGTYSISLQNSAGNRNYVTTFSVPSANTWTKITKDIALDNSGTWLFDNGVGINLVIILTGGSNTQTSTLDTWSAAATTVSNTQTQWAATTAATFFVSQVMLVPGDFSGTDVDIPFTRCGRSISDELAMCQRYYQIINMTNYITAFSSAATAGIAPNPIVFPVEMRATPSLTATSLATTLVNITANTSAGATLTLQGQSTRQGRMFPSGTSDGIVYGYSGVPIFADAEL